MITSLEQNYKTHNKGLVLENKGFITMFLETIKVNEMGQIKECLRLIPSKEKGTLNTIFFRSYKCSSQSVTHKLPSILRPYQRADEVKTFHNNTNTSFAFLTVLIFVVMMQTH